MSRKAVIQLCYGQKTLHIVIDRTDLYSLSREIFDYQVSNRAAVTPSCPPSLSSKRMMSLKLGGSVRVGVRCKFLGQSSIVTVLLDRVAGISL